MEFSIEIERKLHEYVKCEIVALRDPTSKKKLTELLGLRSSEVGIYKTPVEKDRLRPGITIHPVTEMLGSGTCNTDDIGYGAAVTFVQGTGRGDRDLCPIRIFRQMIRGRFLHKKMVIEDCCFWQTTIEHGAWVAPRWLQSHQDYSSLALRCWAEQERIS